jgi:hypothetical protein
VEQDRAAGAGAGYVEDETNEATDAQSPRQVQIGVTARARGWCRMAGAGYVDDEMSEDAPPAECRRQRDHACPGK